MEKTNHMMHSRHSAVGFTLIELMFTLVIVVIVAAIAVPNMRTFTLNNRLTSTAAEFLRSIQSARTEAVKRQVNVVLCTSTDPTSSSAACNTSSLTGWIVFQDTNNNWEHDAGEPIIESHTYESTKMYLLADADKRISFAATGFANPAGAKTPSTSMVMCDSRGNVDLGGQSAARGVVISATGRARLTRVVGSSADSFDITDLLAKIGSSCPPA